MRVVVTGATGFLGRALVRQLAMSGVDVLGVSRQAAPGILQVASYEDTPAGDILVHLAEASNRGWVETHGAAYEQQALSTLTALLEKRFGRVVYSSSAVLYGDLGEGKRKVEDLVHVADTYTRLKHSSERRVLDNGGTVARFVNVYGPGMAESNVLSTILRQIDSDGPLRVLDTTPVRDFLWIQDAAEALSQMCKVNAPGIFNVGTGQGTSILELARIALNAAGHSDKPIVSADTGGNKRSRLVVAIEQTTAAFGWSPTTTVLAGIESLVKKRKQLGTT